MFITLSSIKLTSTYIEFTLVSVSPSKYKDTFGHTIKYFWGIQGQYNIIIEDLDMVISIFSDYRKYSHRKDFEIIIKNIIKNARKIVFNK